jgi:hypothetical protein
MVVRLNAKRRLGIDQKKKKKKKQNKTELSFLPYALSGDAKWDLLWLFELTSQEGITNL